MYLTATKADALFHTIDKMVRKGLQKKQIAPSEMLLLSANIYAEVLALILTGDAQ